MRTVVASTTAAFAAVAVAATTGNLSLHRATTHTPHLQMVIRSRLA